MGAWGYPLGYEEPGTDFKHRQTAFDREVSDALWENGWGDEVTSDSWGTSQDTDEWDRAAGMRKREIVSV